MNKINSFNTCAPIFQLEPLRNTLDSNTLRLYHSNESCLEIRLKQLKKILYDNTEIPVKEVKQLFVYLKKNLPTLVGRTIQAQRDVYLRSRETGLILPLEISKSGDVLLPLKKWGAQLGSGNYRKTKQAIIFSQPDLPLVAHSTEKFKKLKKKIYSNNEINILKKISQFLIDHPQVKGLLKFYTFVDYLSKPKESDTKQLSENGYDVCIADQSEEEISFQPLEKRAIATKFYNGGNLNDCLDQLTAVDKINAAWFLLNGLVILHDLKIFHSDIKLDNIFIEKDSKSDRLIEAVIGDYGFACDLTNITDRFYKNGHRTYRAPELMSDQFTSGSPIDEKIFSADIYAMGLVFQELFSNIQHPILKTLNASMLEQTPEKRPSAKEAQTIFLQFFQSLQISKRQR
jgi:serine/threonine protein kinase